MLQTLVISTFEVEGAGVETSFQHSIDRRDLADGKTGLL
jgi:hypothetical protein